MDHEIYENLEIKDAARHILAQYGIFPEMFVLSHLEGSMDSFALEVANFYELNGSEEVIEDLEILCNYDIRRFPPSYTKAVVEAVGFGLKNPYHNGKALGIDDKQLMIKQGFLSLFPNSVSYTGNPIPALEAMQEQNSEAELLPEGVISFADYQGN